VRSGLDVPTFATRRLHACHHARARSGGRWNCGREMSGKFCLNAESHDTFRDLLHAVKLRHGTDGFTSPPKEGVLGYSYIKFFPTSFILLSWLPGCSSKLSLFPRLFLQIPFCPIYILCHTIKIEMQLITQVCYFLYKYLEDGYRKLHRNDGTWTLVCTALHFIRLLCWSTQCGTTGCDIIRHCVISFNTQGAS